MRPTSEQTWPSARDLDAAGPLIVDLGCSELPDAAVIGGKAMGLERLMALELPCPPAFCVTTAALDLYMDRTGLGERVKELVASLPDDAALSELRTVAYAEELPPELGDALTEATDRLRSRAPGVELVAIRSSATDEDGDRHSFAGLHETQLGTTIKGIPASLRRCWASLWGEGSLTYRAERGLPATGAAMAVVVQELVAADASAVVFTANPMTGSADQLVIQSTHGLGAPLVDSEITPDTAIVEKQTLGIARLEVGQKQVRLDARPSGGLVRLRVVDEAPALAADEIRALAELSIRAEQGLGGPVDIEAALSGGDWQLIQARPITATGGSGM